MYYMQETSLKVLTEKAYFPDFHPFVVWRLKRALKSWDVWVSNTVQLHLWHSTFRKQSKVLKLKSHISEIKHNTKPTANQIELLCFVEVIYI